MENTLNTLVWCKTKSQLFAVLTEAKRRGYSVDSVTRMTESFWSNHHEETVVNLNSNGRTITYCYKDWYINNPGYGKIITADKFFGRKPILITRKGRVVIAENKNTGDQAIATCSPDDEFDFGTGAMIAVARLISQSDKGITKDAETVIRQLLGDDVSSNAPSDEEPTTKFKVGDLVTLKDGLEASKVYGGITLLGNMYRNGNCKPLKVVEVDSNGHYSCAPTDESIDVVVPYWYAEEMIEPWDENKIREGDIVRVVSTGKTFDTYFEWVARNVEEKNLIARFKCDCLPPITNNYEVVKIAPHGDCSELLAYIKSTATNRCYVVGIKGLEKVTE